jgi:nitrile hydratase
MTEGELAALVTRDAMIGVAKVTPPGRGGMNGIHDMGGMHGFGPVEPEANEPVFHQRWEARTHAIAKALGSWGKWNIDYGRHERELIPPAEYLRMSYYEKWLARNMFLMVKHGLVTQDELETGKPAPGSQKLTHG